MINPDKYLFTTYRRRGIRDSSKPDPFSRDELLKRTCTCACGCTTCLNSESPGDEICKACYKLGPMHHLKK